MTRRHDLQEAAREHWLNFTSDDAPDTDMYEKDFHWWGDAQTALDMGDMFVMTGFKVLPRQGGWLDQDWYEAQDLLTYMHGYNWAYRLNHPREDEDKPKDDFDPLDMQFETYTTDLQDLM